jgi:hypothetical protein
MNYPAMKWRLAASALLAAAAVAGCHGDGDNGAAVTTPTAPPATQMTQFSTFTKSVFAQSVDSTPQSLDNVTFNFDVDDDPTAFDGLLT